MTSTAASLRTRRDTTAAVHPPTAGAHRLPPRALLHLIGRITFAVAQSICTAVARLLYSAGDFTAETVEPQHLRSYIHIGTCVNCDGARVLTRTGTCESCGSESVIHRPGYKRGAFNVEAKRRRLVSVQRRTQTATALRQVRVR